MIFKMTIFTLKDISGEDTARELFKLLEEMDFTPDKIGHYEPLKQEYSLEMAVKLLTTHEPGCYEDGIGMTGFAGGIDAKSKMPRYNLQVMWWKCPDDVSANWFNLRFTNKTFSTQKESLICLFKEVITLTGGIYGYITHDKPYKRQHVTGGIDTRMPGVFWCNYFGKPYVDFFGEEKLKSFSWTGIEELNKGLITFLAPEPHKELVQSDELENKAKIHLGLDSFGDVKEYYEHPFDMQIRNVPSLEDLSKYC